MIEHGRFTGAVICRCLDARCAGLGRPRRNTLDLAVLLGSGVFKRSLYRSPRYAITLQREIARARIELVDALEQRRTIDGLVALRVGEALEQRRAVDLTALE